MRNRQTHVFSRKSSNKLPLGRQLGPNKMQFYSRILNENRQSVATLRGLRNRQINIFARKIAKKHGICMWLGGASLLAKRRVAAVAVLLSLQNGVPLQWRYFFLSKTVCRCSDSALFFGLTCADLGSFGLIWADLGQSGLVWDDLGSSGLI